MTTIHLSDAQRDTFTACRLIVIDGESRWAAPGETRYALTVNDAPELWRILSEPCETCGGAGMEYRNERLDSQTADLHWQERRCANPGCVGGRRVVTLTATCSDCSGSGWVAPFDEACDCDDGAVTLGRFTIPALLPFDGTLTIDLRLGNLRPDQFVARPEPVK